MKFQSFTGIRVLVWFMSNPTRRIHFKELCRQLALSPLTVKTYCDEFVRLGWLLEERNANLRIFVLDNGNYVVRSFKRAHQLTELSEANIGNTADEMVISMALFGSYASGEYDERSDIDLLVIGRKEQVRNEEIKKIEKKLGKQIQLTIFPLEEWERRKTGDPFAASILRMHVLLKGAPL